jgi:hypothetical protein
MLLTDASDRSPLHVADCPNHAVALNRLREILSAESFATEVREVLVADAIDGSNSKVSRFSNEWIP